jgi:hypothetical protein
MENSLDELSDFPTMKRMQRYIALAGDARREAERANGSARNSYLIIAERWERLANKVARHQIAEKSNVPA